jgi:hypothetical protein
MHLIVCMHNLHFNLIINLFKHDCKMCQVFTYSSQKIMMNAKCNSWIMELTNSKWFNSCENVDILRDVKKIISMFKYKCKALNCCVWFKIYINKCNLQHSSANFNNF